MPIDNDTGLPVLPSGQVWRVEFPEEGDHAWLHIVPEANPTSRRPILGSIASTGIYGGMWGFFFRGDLLPMHRVKPRHIRKAAKKLLKKRAKTQRIQQRSAARAAAFGGIYPPKRL